MSTEKIERPWTVRKLDDFAEVFERQNWRVKEGKETNKDPKMISKEDVWKSWVGLDSEEELDQVLDWIIAHSQVHVYEIVMHIAKAMYYDKTSFEDTLALYWFTSDQMNIFKPKVANRLRDIKEAHAEKDAAAAIRNHLFPAVENVVQKGGKYIIAFKNQAGRLEKAELPKQLKNVSDLLEKEEFEHDPNDIKRTSVAYRLRTDCAEIIKLGAAACDTSATQFVENLALEGAQMLVRAKVAETSVPSRMVDHFVSHELYRVLNHRYVGSSGGYFPVDDSDLNKATETIRASRRWVPEGVKVNETSFPSKADAQKWAVKMLGQLTKKLDRVREEFDINHDFLSKLNRIDESDFEEMMKEHALEEMARQRIVTEDNSASVDSNSESLAV